MTRCDGLFAGAQTETPSQPGADLAALDPLAQDGVPLRLSSGAELETPYDLEDGTLLHAVNHRE